MFPDLSIAVTSGGTKFALLNGRVHAMVNTYADALRMTDERVQEEILHVSQQAGFRYFRIIVEVTDGTCTRCLAG